MQWTSKVAGVLAAIAVVAAAPALAADTLTAAEIDGVQVGMTKPEALAALRKSHPRDTPVELYGGMVEMHGFIKLPKKNLRPHDVDIFTALVVESPVDALKFGCSSLDSSPRTQVRIEVLFTANPADPRVVHVDKTTRYCGSKPPGVREEISALRARHGTLVGRSENVDLQFNRLNGEASYRNAFLEWRAGGMPFVMKSMGTVAEYNMVGLPADIGNPGGGIVLHAIVIPHPADINSVREVQLYLWDDDQMTHWLADHDAVRVRMNQRDWGFADLAKPAVVQELTDAYLASVNSRKTKVASPTPGGPGVPPVQRTPDPVPENPALRGRTPDAEVRIEGQPTLGVSVMTPLELTVPVGATLIDPMPFQLSNYGKVTYTAPAKLLFFEFMNCNPPPGWPAVAVPRDFPLCAKLIPVPEGVLGEPEPLSNSAPENPRKRYRVSREFKLTYQKSVGRVNAGTRLYRVDAPVPNANDLGYRFQDGDAYTWFLVDPAACVAGDGKAFDCSKPIALPDSQWHPLR